MLETTILAILFIIVLTLVMRTTPEIDDENYRDPKDSSSPPKPNFQENSRTNR